ncbi:MAG: diguanylate cyclase [Candidatus Omnitrophica bacterium]|nr:diguanylate cyclase [Candidatus Omnitrophota bacterium]
MNLIKDKIYLGFVASILFIYLTFFLLHIDTRSISEGSFFIFTNIYLLFFNAIIAASWFAFGWIGGAIFLAFSIIIALSLSLATGNNIYYIHAGLFSITALLSFNSLRGFVAFQTEYQLKTERIGEEKNTLFKRMERDRAQAQAFELKFKRYELLKNVAEYLSDIFSQEKIVKFLAQKSFAIIGKSTRSLIYLINPYNQELILTYSKQPQDFPRIKTKKGDIFDKWVLKQNQPLIVLNTSRDFRFPQDDILLDEVRIKSVIAVPMVSHNKMIGLLRLDNQEPDIYNPDDLRLLDIVGDLGAVALHNNMLYQRTTELAIRDGLTQLFVYRYFMERLTTEFRRAQKSVHPFSILMIDIDHFKEYNDKYGHIAGDILLKHLATMLTSIVSKGDIVARYGGEEFAIALFDEKKEDAKRLAENIRDAVDENIFYLRREETHATISIGVSTYPDDAKTARDLLKVADQNLYRAKKEGRNRVCTS